MKRYVLVAAVFAVACGAPKYSPVDGPPDDSWPAFRFDAQRSGYSPTALTGTSASELWRVADINTTDYGAAKGSPSVADGVVYVGSDDERFGAYDADSGEQMWETTIEGTSHGIHGTPSIGAENVYVGAYNGTLYAFDRESGDEVWTYERGFQVGASPILVPEHGRIYNTHERSSHGGGFIVAVDAETGEQAWKRRIRAHPHSSVAVSVEREMLYVGDNLALLHAIDARNGNRVWRVQLEQTKDAESDIKTTPTVIEEHDIVVVGAWSKKVHAFDLEAGDLIWETDLGAKIMGSTAYAPGLDMVFVGTLSPTRSLHALDAATGKEVWRQEIGSVMSSPAINGDESLVVVGSGLGKVYALDTETGEVVWSEGVGGNVTGSPALWRDRVYITARQGDLVAFETSDEE